LADFLFTILFLLLKWFEVRRKKEILQAVVLILKKPTQKIALFEGDGIEYRHNKTGFLTGRQTF